MTIPFTSTTSAYSFSITNIYALSDHRDTDAFLADLGAMSPPSDTNWLVIRDFNLTRAPADKNNTNFDQRLAAKFNSAIDGLIPIDLSPGLIVHLV
jgi:hypothetical protein